MGISRALGLASLVLVVGAFAALAALVHPATAGSAESPAGTNNVAGTVSTRMVVDGFRAVGRRVVGRGTIISTFTNPAGAKTVRRKHFRLGIRSSWRAQHLQQQQQTCQILLLELGELDLTLAGLHATLKAADPTQPIQLRLTATRENGVLGRLFCDLAGGSTLATSQKASSAARTLTKRLKRTSIMRVKAIMYAPNRNGGAARGSTTYSPQGAAQEAECDVLHLVLGPLHLDLLGLVVDLNKVILDLKAIPGTLLGNIFCQLVTQPPPPPPPAAPAPTG